MSTDFEVPTQSSSTVKRDAIHLARLSRGYTQSELATKMGISQANVSKMEMGSIQVTDEALTSLSEAVQYPKHFFMQDWRVEGPGIHDVHHRKRRRVSARLLNRIHAIATIQREQTLLLLRSYDGWEDHFQAFPIDEFDGKPDKIARTVRAMWRLPLGPVASVTETIERAGGIIFSWSFGTNLIDAFSRWVPPSPPMFWINADAPPDRLRWTLCHELGHIIMHTVGNLHECEEDEANIFASEFLMPAYEIKPRLVGLTFPKLAGLKLEWRVSIQALIMTANRLHVLSDRQKQHMFMQLSKAGYRTREPEELDPPIEEPKLFADIIQFHKRELEYTNASLSEALAMHEAEFVSLYKTRPAHLRIVK